MVENEEVTGSLNVGGGGGAGRAAASAGHMGAAGSRYADHNKLYTEYLRREGKPKVFGWEYDEGEAWGG
ncbi:hypothetical protein LTR28_000686 [Elasticomyces elasticus]|nr:hypothetical protein LTR28_000686 [Elasticomyces elasticus]